MNIDNSKFKIDEEVSDQIYGSFQKVYYDGIHIGYFHKIGNYPAKVKTYNSTWQGSFTSTRQAMRSLLVQSETLGKVVRLNTAVRPSAKYILQIIDLSFVGNDENATIFAKVFYNSDKVAGRSANSKPCTSELMEIDLKNKKFISLDRNNITFANADEMIEQIHKALIGAK